MAHMDEGICQMGDSVSSQDDMRREPDFCYHVIDSDSSSCEISLMSLPDFPRNYVYAEGSAYRVSVIENTN
jgi:hypothetical protein